ncbi:MAG: cysteine desulfurase family protein [Rhodothermia bacterium]
MSKPIYLDNNATTPVDKRVLEAMVPFFSQEFGNPSSRTHAYGWAADEAVARAREQVAALIGGDPDRVIFTSGATEAINLAIKGLARAHARKGRHIVVTQTEHKAVLDVCRSLERDGFEITYLPVNQAGIVDIRLLQETIRVDTILVGVIWANNETGVIQPIDEIAEVVRSKRCILFSDSTQAVGKIPVSASQVDLLTFSAHKFYGPKGVGALYLGGGRPVIRLTPQIDGGGQESGRRGGTLNTPGIVGLGMAAVIAEQELENEGRRLARLRDRLETAIIERLEGTQVNGSRSSRLSGTTNIRFPGLSSAKLIPQLHELAISAGSACSSGSGRPSHVLKALGLTDEEAGASIRIGLGRFTTESEIDRAIDIVIEKVEAQWTLNPS